MIWGILITPKTAVILCSVVYGILREGCCYKYLLELHELSRRDNCNFLYSIRQKNILFQLICFVFPSQRENSQNFFSPVHSHVIIIFSHFFPFPISAFK